MLKGMLFWGDDYKKGIILYIVTLST